MASIARFFIILKKIVGIFLVSFVITFLLSNCPKIKSYDWLTKVVKWVIDIFLREKLCFKSVRHFHLSFSTEILILPVFVVVFIAMRLNVMSYC